MVPPLEKARKNMMEFAAANAGLLAVSGAVVYGIKQSVLAASDLDESMNKVNVVFERNADSIQDWARTTSTEIGISRQAALEAAGTYGNLFTALGLTTDAAAEMSMSTVQLAADLASFNNEDPSEVLLALRSGLSGEMEPLKRFGIAMNQAVLAQKAMEMGLGDNIQALSEAEKVQVRYAVIMEQTATAQGDFARTSDGLANTQRTIKANFEDIKAILGEEFLPDVNAAAIEVKNFTSWVVENAEEIKEWANIISWANPGKWGVEIGKAARNLFGFSDASEESADSAADLVNETNEIPESMEDAEAAAKALEDALKEQSKAYSTVLGNMQKIQDENDRFADQKEQRGERQKRLEEEKVRLAIESGDEQKKIKRDLAELDRDIANESKKQAKTKEQRAAKEERLHDMNVKRADLLERINKAQQEAAVAQVEIDDKLKQLEEDKVDAIEDQEQARKRLLYATLEQKATEESSAGGKDITQEEFEFLQNMQVELGLTSAESAKTAIKISEDANRIYAEFQTATGSVNDVRAALQDVVAGSPYNIKINIETAGSVPSVGGSGSSLPVGLSKNRNDARRGRSFQEGGSFIVPGTGRGDRPFLVGLEPGERVDVTPRNGSHNSVVINITGVLDRTMVNRITQEVTRAQVQ